MNCYEKVIAAIMGVNPSSMVGPTQVVCWNWNFDTLCQHHYDSRLASSIRNWMRENTHILQFECRNIDEMRAMHTAKCAMTINLKCRNDQIRAKRAENKVKPSNIENNLYSQCVRKFIIVQNGQKHILHLQNWNRSMCSHFMMNSRLRKISRNLPKLAQNGKNGNFDDLQQLKILLMV